MAGEQARVCDEAPLQMIEVKQEVDGKSAAELDQLGLDFSEMNHDDHAGDFCNAAMSIAQGKAGSRFMPESLLAQQHAITAKEKLDYFSLHHRYQPVGTLPTNNLEQELVTAELGNVNQQLNRIEFETLPRQQFKHSETLPIS